jgi:hypothetical protein
VWRVFIVAAGLHIAVTVIAFVVFCFFDMGHRVPGTWGFEPNPRAAATMAILIPTAHVFSAVLSGVDMSWDAVIPYMLFCLLTSTALYAGVAAAFARVLLKPHLPSK